MSIILSSELTDFFLSFLITGTSSIVTLRSIFSGSGVENSSTLPVHPPKSSVPPATALNPEATAGSKSPASAPPPRSHSPKLKPFAWALLMMVLVPFFAII